MTQVEIAKKILEQGSCGGVKCYDDNCPFMDIVCDTTDKQKWIEKIKQWLKEQEKEMIDLTKEQMLTKPVKCWVKNKKEDASMWRERWLKIISNGVFYSYVDCSHNDDYSNEKQLNYWDNCTLTDPTKKFKPWLKVEDVPVELWGKVLFKKRSERNYMANILTPSNARYTDNELPCNLVYLPLGQPLTGEWLEMGEWV